MSFNTRIGMEIAGYRLERQLGQGAFAAVYVAEHMRLGNKVAMKVLDPTLARDEGMCSRFIQESRIAAELDHPGIIPILNAGEQDGLLFIVMKYVQGRDLYALVREHGTISAMRTASFIDQIAGGLDAAHAKGLVHRDIKPQNILIEDNTERAYLIDFGIVKRTTPPAAGGDTPYTSIGFKGTAYYAPPEQIDGLECDARSDVYALGGVVYECLTGSPPYGHMTEWAAMAAQVSEPPPSVVAARPELPYTLDSVVTTAMAKRPDDRYSSCGELATALRAAALGRPAERAAEASAGREELPGRETVISSAQKPVSLASGAPTDEDPQGGGGIRGGGGKDGSSGDDGSGDSGAGGGRGGSRGRRSRGVSDSPRWLVAMAALGIIAVAALALLGAYQLGKDSSGDHEAGGDTTTTHEMGDTTPSVTTATEPESNMPAAMDADETKLWNSIPKPLRKACQLATPEHAGGVGTINCDYTDPNHGRTLFHLDRFSDAEHLNSSYAMHGSGEVVAHGGTVRPAARKTGNCNNIGWLGEGGWGHETSSSTSPLAGRYACYQAKGTCDLVAKLKLTDLDGPVCSVVVWTDLSASLFVKAEQQTDNHGELFGFFHFWQHKFG